MADLKLIRTDENDFDISFFSNDIELDNTLETSVFVSLISWLYDADTSQNSWFAEQVLLQDIPFGSRLHLLFQETITDNTLNLVKSYVNECLKWMIDDGIASSVDINVFRVGTHSIGFSVIITRPNDLTEDFEYFINWESQIIERALNGI